MKRMLSAWAVVAAAALATVSGCETVEPTPTVTYDGRAIFVGYCASCHGPTGAGDGPVAPSLAFTMEDLRTIEERRGDFPTDWLREIIDGRSLRAAHGTADMPVWGYEFRAAEESEAGVTARIDALIEFLRSIQGTRPKTG